MKMKKFILLAYALVSIAIVAFSAQWLFVKEPQPKLIGYDDGCDGKWERARERGASPLNAEAVYHYSIPRWYQKSMNFVDRKQVKFGKEFEVYARTMPWLTDMENVEIEYVVSNGLRITEGESLMKCGGGQKCAFNELIRMCDIREKRFKVKWESEPDKTQRIQFVFRFDFPHEELLQFVEEKKDSDYQSEELREDLIDYIKNDMRDTDDDSLMLFIN